MSHCFYHTDLGQQNAVFHSFAIIQIAIIQYSGRSKHAWALAKPLTRDAAPEGYQVRPVSLQTLQPSFQNMPSEIGFPTLTSDVFLNQKPNKQTSHE